LEVFKSQVAPKLVFPISAATGEGIEHLLDAVINKLALIPKYPTVFEFEKPEDDEGEEPVETEIVKEDEAFRVKNRVLEKRILRYDLENEYSLQSFQRLLKRWGIPEALIAAGVKEGDSVRIGEYEFTFFNDD